MRLLQKLDISKKIGTTLGLSDLELERILEEGLEGVREFYKQNPEHARAGNYFFSREFHDKARDVKGRIPESSHREIPAIIVGRSEGGYTLQYNSQLDDRINKSLEQFKARDGMPNVDSFSRAIVKNREWCKERKLEIVIYLCQEQATYIESEDPKDLKRLRQENVAKKIGYSISTVSYLMKNLTIQLPDGRVIYARDLVPSNRVENSEGYLHLKELQKEQPFYENGEWKVSDMKLRIVLKEKFRIDIARRTISKYRERIEQEK